MMLKAYAGIACLAVSAVLFFTPWGVAFAQDANNVA